MADEMNERMQKMPDQLGDHLQQDTCLRCGSPRIIRNVRIVDRSHANRRRDLCAELYEDPGALIFKGTHEARLLGNICADCGHVEVYIINPQELWEVYQSLPPELRPGT